MNEGADSLEGLVTVDAGLEPELEARLRESSTLAFRVAYGVLRHRQDAEDVAQDAFVKADRSFRQLRARPRFRAPRGRMTRRGGGRGGRRGSLRRAGANPADASPAEPATAVQPLDDLAARERAAELWAAIDALPDKLRVVIVLASIQEHDIGEVAQLLDLPDGTVKSRLFLARQRLKEQLQCS